MTNTTQAASPAPPSISAQPTEGDQGLLFAWSLDPAGGKPVGWNELRSAFSSATPDQPPIWGHLKRSDPAVQNWLREESGLDELVCDALLAEETRPRITRIGQGLVVILRGVNLNPGAEPNDMISVRMWIERNRIITLRAPKLKTLRAIHEELQAGQGPTDPPAVLAAIAAGLTERMGPVIHELAEHADELEERLIDTPGYELRTKLSALRREAIALRRYLGPQREVLTQLQHERIDWLTDSHRAELRESNDRLLRHIEDMDAARERAAVSQEELAGRLSDQMNRSMYALSLVAGVFLPLGFLTGLLGINVGGMPGVEDNHAFWVVCALLLIMAVGSIFLLRRLRFF